MVWNCLGFVLLVGFCSRGGGDKCIIKTESGVKKSVCCADSEEKGNDCIACTKGYTSKTGHICRPCPNNTYGDRCKHECSCSAFEICNIVEGCVEISTIPTTVYSILADITTLPKNPDGSTIGHGTDNDHDSVDGRLSTEIIIIFALSAIVIVFGVCLCVIFYKYKSAANKKKSTINQSQNPPLPQNNHSIEMEYRLYDIINDADLLDDHDLQQMQMSSGYLDVISTGSIKSSNTVNQNSSCWILPSAQTKTHAIEADYVSVISGDNTSSSDEDNQEATEDYLNPYQPVIKMSPPKKREYLTLATVHTTDNSLPDYNTSAISQKEHGPHDHLQLEQDSLRRIYSINIGGIDPKCNIKEHVSMSCANLNVERLNVNKNQEKEDIDKTSTEDYRLDCYTTFRTKSESDVSCTLSMLL